jgi:hypothetical protein
MTHPSETYRHYDAFMKNKQMFPLLLVWASLASSVLAQTTTSAKTAGPGRNPVSVARTQYIQSESDSLATNKYLGSKQGQKEDDTLAQFSRPQPALGSYPQMLSGPPGSGLHVLVGAAIGFGVGAGAGAAGGGGNKIPVAGLMGAFFGGVIGSCINSAHRFHRHRAWDDEEYDELGSSLRPRSSDRKTMAQAAGNKAAAKRQMALGIIRDRIVRGGNLNDGRGICRFLRDNPCRLRQLRAERSKEHNAAAAGV